MILGLYLHTFSFISQFIIVVALKFKDFPALTAFFKDSRTFKVRTTLRLTRVTGMTRVINFWMNEVTRVTGMAGITGITGVTEKTRITGITRRTGLTGDWG